MKEKIKIAVIGCGRFSPFFVPLFKKHPSVEKVYVCDLIRERAEKFSERFGVDIIDSFDEALNSDKVNSVAIFTQRYKHGPMVIEALKAGKNVYSAVPGAIRVEELCEIEALVRKTRLVYTMGETGYYRAPTIFCRREYKKGTFGKFTWGEAHYNHDIRNMVDSFKSSEGDGWRSQAGIPPFFYPTHSTSMILGSMPGVYAKKVVAMGHRDSRSDIYGEGGVNAYNNPFGNEAMLMELSNGGIARISENRCLGWKSPETYISQFYGTDGGYEFSVARHSLSVWDPERHGACKMVDVTRELQPKEVYELIESDYASAIQKIADSYGFRLSSPIQLAERKMPVEWADEGNGHNGTHQFLIDDFCRAYDTGKLSPTNIWAVARFNIPGLLAHESAMAGGKVIDVPDLGNPPSDWEVLDAK